MDLIKRRLEEINRRLKVARIGVALEIRGERIYLRGTFPPKPGKSGYSQQRISLGVYANSEGLNFAESEAKIIGGLLAQNKFDWSGFLAVEKNPVYLVSHWVSRLENDYFTTHERTPTSEQTWKIDYYQPLMKLPQDQQLSKEILEKTLLSETKPNTRSRRRYALAYALLSDLAKIDHHFRELVGNYSIKAVSPRSLPDDQIIANSRESLENPSWQWAYGMQATFGLRNHEIFFTDLDDWPIAYVNRGKTSERYVWPLFPEWADRWELKNVLKPEVSGEKNSDYGSRVTQAYKRLGVPFSPYNLRHCWARRSIEFGLDVSLAAAQMGHSVKIHTDVYRLWIDRKTHERAMSLILSRADRPLPPNT